MSMGRYCGLNYDARIKIKSISRDIAKTDGYIYSYMTTIKKALKKIYLLNQLKKDLKKERDKIISDFKNG